MTNITSIRALNNTLSQSGTASSTSDVDFSSYLSSNKSLDAIFQEASDTYGVSVDLLKAIAKQESNFDPNATSRSGAQGIMQLMPATAAGLGVTNSYDPYQNIMGGAKYISQKLSQYNGNVSLALAAYNAGSNNVAKYGGIPPFAETQNYVVKVTGYLNQGVTTPDSTYSVSPSDSSSSSMDYSELNSLAGNILDHIFSYDDYLSLISSMLSQNKSLSIQYIADSLTEDSNEKQDETSGSTVPTDISAPMSAYQTLSNSSLMNQLLSGTGNNSEA